MSTTQCAIAQRHIAKCTLPGAPRTQSIDPQAALKIDLLLDAEKIRRVYVTVGSGVLLLRPVQLTRAGNAFVSAVSCGVFYVALRGEGEGGVNRIHTGKMR